MREGDTAPAVSQDTQFWLFAGTFPSHLCPFSREKHMEPAGAIHFPGCRQGWQHKVMYKITPNKQIWESQSETLSGKPVPGPKQAVKQLHTPLGQKIKSCWGVSRSTGNTEPHRASQSPFLGWPAVLGGISLLHPCSKPLLCTEIPFWIQPHG